MKRWNRRGQTAIEYAMIITVVVIAVALLAKSLFQPAVEKVLTDSAGAITNASTNLATKLQ